MSSDDTFLSRWSKRKREALTQPAAEAEAPVGEGQQTQAGEGEDQPFDLSLLPDLETLTGESDIQSFLHKAVPDTLRNAALRKVWALDPAVRNYVGEALDYAYDWNTPGGVPGFGDILSDEQSLEFVRNLLAGPDSDEKVIETAAARDLRYGVFAGPTVVVNGRSAAPHEVQWVAVYVTGRDGWQLAASQATRLPA